MELFSCYKLRTVLMAFLIVCLKVGEPKSGVWKTTSVSCTYDLNYFINPVCRLKAINRNTTIFSIGATLVTKLENFSIRVKQSQKMNSNRYMPGMFNIKSSVCELVGSLFSDKPSPLKMVLLSISPSVFENYKDVIRPCPYPPAKYYVNETIRPSTEAPFLNYFPISDFKIEYTFTDDDNDGKTVFQYTVFATTK